MIIEERYIQFFRFFEQTKATQIWAYWNKKDIALPFNGVLPKGEIGLNPCFDKMSVKFFEGAVDKIVDKTVFVRKVRQVKAVVATELGSPRHAFRRDRF
jgi:hypothetical protein